MANTVLVPIGVIVIVFTAAPRTSGATVPSEKTSRAKSNLPIKLPLCRPLMRHAMARGDRFVKQGRVHQPGSSWRKNDQYEAGYLWYLKRLDGSVLSSA
jgi:hypothetical protein